jgi:hypothetical protein
MIMRACAGTLVGFDPLVKRKPAPKRDNKSVNRARTNKKAKQNQCRGRTIPVGLLHQSAISRSSSPNPAPLRKF